MYILARVRPLAQSSHLATTCAPMPPDPRQGRLRPNLAKERVHTLLLAHVNFRPHASAINNMPQQTARIRKLRILNIEAGHKGKGVLRAAVRPNRQVASAGFPCSRYCRYEYKQYARVP